MKKTFKKFILSFLLTLLLVPLFSVSAYEPRTLSMYAKELGEVETTILDGGVVLKKQQLSTVYNGILGDKEIWNLHTVQWLSIPSESTAVKPVVWSVGSTEDWKPTDVIKAANDYENKHPGYIVVGAVNGDFFDNSAGGTNEPTNYHVQEGDVLRAHWNGASYRGVVAFGATNKDYAAGIPTKSANMYIKTLNGNEVIDSIEVVGTNKAPSESGATVYNKDLSKEVDLTGYTVYEGSYSMFRRYTGGYFIKGKITKVASLGKISSVEAGKFYIANKGESLNTKLALDQALKIEYNLSGVIEGSNNVIGYNYKILENGKPLLQADNTNNHIYTTHPRTVIGFKSDGSITTMVIDGRGTIAQCLEGASLFQCGEMLRIAGCVEGYNLDGGGSSTLVARINGQLTLINDPSDARQTGQPWGTLRSTGNAILFVMQDPKLTIEPTVGNTIAIKKTGELLSGTLQNVKLVIGNKAYEMTSDRLVVENLKKDTEYNVSYTYEIKNEDGTIDKGISKEVTLKTENYAFPTLTEFKEYTVGEGSVTLKYSYKDEDSVVKSAYILCGDQKIVLESNSGRVTIENLNSKIENEFIITLELTNGSSVDVGSIKYDANTIPEKIVPTEPIVDEKEETKKGCKKSMLNIVVSLISITSILVLFRKKK